MDFSRDLKNELDRIKASGGQPPLARLYEAVSVKARECVEPVWNAGRRADKKRAYYLSAEFLMGRVVSSNLLNMNLLDSADEILKSEGGVNRFEQVDDCALGNGGLGRLAACFLDSAASLGLPLDGYGIRYKYGLFKQSFTDGFQTESADDWSAVCGDPWSVRCADEAVTVEFSDQTVRAVPYDMPVIGYGAETVNTLRLWQSEAVSDFDFTRFDRGDYAGAVKEKNDAERISAVLYPNDNSAEGKRLRLKQEYFFTSASIQDILRKFDAKGGSLEQLPDFAAVQLNDTHPVFAVPELIRLLKKRGVAFKAALRLAFGVFSYTNHTVMSEALEKWDVKLVKKLLPDVFKVIAEIQKALAAELFARNADADNLNIVDGDKIHMARMAVYCCRKTNGVAKIHTEILKSETLKEWYALYPERFCNKTNGITQRRWLKLCNKGLSDLITEKIGDGWVKNLDELEKLKAYADDGEVLARFQAIKRKNKERLCEYIEKKEGVRLDPDFIFDIQIKRLHEYKRQFLNALSLVYLYNGIKEGSVRDFHPTAFIFGAKAAPGYKRAKGIIKFISEIAKKINSDPEMRDKMRVVFVTDYNVSYAEKLVAAGDISEQISAAGTEASGTGNMKLMLNGAVTLGTYDGANIEIAEAAGEENNFIFGARVDELNRIRDSYSPREILERDEKLKAAVETLIDGTFSDGGTGLFRELYDSLLQDFSYHKADQYFVLYDFRAYVEAKLKANACYARPEFVKMCFMNTASAGRFSSDRTIKEYAREIWNI